MKRNATEELKKWQTDPERKPMVLRGARQVGKTWLMKEFGKTQFKKVAYVTFYNNQRMKRVFNDDYDIDRIIMNINIEAKTEVTPEDTLIILDEIQDAPRALEASKYFCENAPEYAVVAAGSLLGVAIHDGVSYPVGKVEQLNLYPMCYGEFLKAMGEEQLADLLEKGDFRLITDCREKYIHWLKNYYYVGGMPEAVHFFSEHKDYTEVRRIQNSLLAQYEDDFGKHAGGNELPRIRMVWNSIPIQLAKENKKFFFGQIKTGGRMKEFETAIEWLKACGLITKVNKVSKPAVPLKAYVDFSAFKLFLVDIGLLGAMSELDAASILEGNEIFVEFKGALTEQYVLQELIAGTDYTPYYHISESGKYEMDFMIQKGKHVVPIEVKAETNLRARSLQAYHQKYEPPYAVRVSMADYRQDDWMTNIPLYAVNRI